MRTAELIVVLGVVGRFSLAIWMRASFNRPEESTELSSSTVERLVNFMVELPDSAVSFRRTPA